MTDQECFEAAKKCGLTNAEFSAWRHFLYLYAAEIERVATEKERERVLLVISRNRNTGLFMSIRAEERPEGGSCKTVAEVLDLIMHQLVKPGTERPIKDDSKTRVADHVPDSGEIVKQLENAIHRITRLEDRVASLERRIQGLERCEQARQPIGSPGQNGWPGAGSYQAPNVWLHAESKVDLAKVHGLAK